MAKSGSNASFSLPRLLSEQLQRLLLTVGTLAVVALAGCGGSSNSTSTPKTVSAIAVTPATMSMTVGATQQYSATATYSDGSTASVASTVSWTSSSTGVATVSPTGMATGVTAGASTITATLTGVTGTAQLTVASAAKTLTSIAVTPASMSVTVGATQQFAATATYSDGSTAGVSSMVTWTSSSASVATVNAAGLATGVAAGTSTIKATLTGVTGSAQLTVAAAAKTLSSITVTPPTFTIAIGSTQQLAATATYSDKSTVNVTSMVTWTSSSSAFATVSASGLATGVAAGSGTITATLTGVSGTSAFTVSATAKTLTSIAITPNPVSVAVGSTQQLTATGTYSDNTTGNLTGNVTWATSNAMVATVDGAGLLMPQASGSTSVTATLNTVTATDAVTVTMAANTGANITTWQVDSNRSGLNPAETSLTPSTVTAKTFGKLFSYQLDGYEYGEPLLISNVTINSKSHNVVYAATENDSVYAFDADSYGTGAPLWHTSLLQSGETPLTNGPVQPFQGVTSTPVIDLATNTIYVMSTEIAAGGIGTFRLNALDITTGAQKSGSPATIHATVAGTSSDAVNGIVTLTTSCVQRAALLLANGTVYAGFGGCHSGWLLAYDATKLTQTGIFNASPNLNGEGPYASAGGIWMGGGGPVADSAGNVYAVTGNGPWDGKTAYSDSVLKFSPKLGLLSYFTPQDYAYMFCNDADLAAGGMLLIPGTTQALVGGKTGRLYLVNTAMLGGEQANDAGATQTLFFEQDKSAPYSQTCTDTAGTHTTEINSYEIFGTSAFYNGSVYLGVSPTGANIDAGVRRFTYASGELTPSTESTPSIQQGSYGTTPFISANGTADGVLWMIDHGNPLQTTTPSAATLRAYDANDLTTELYNSATNSGDTPGYGIKFTSPIVANGKVYMATGHDLSTVANPKGELDVFGLK